MRIAIFLCFTIFLIFFVPYITIASLSLSSSSSSSSSPLSNNTNVTNNNPTSDAKDISNIGFTKSISDNKILQNGSIVVSILVSNNEKLNLKNVWITDTIPEIFNLQQGQQELFSNNNIKLNLPVLSTSYVISYSIKLKQDLELSKDWNFQLPPAYLQFDIKNNDNNQTLSLQSDKITITLLSKSAELKWYEENWISYLVVLLVISSLAGLFGGITNHIIGYRPNLNLITREINRYLENYNLEFNIKYDDNILLYEKSNITISCTSKNVSTPQSVQPPNIIICELFYNEKYGEQRFNIKVSEKNEPKEFSALFAIEDYGANLRFKIVDNNVESYLEGMKVDINVNRNSIRKTALAGLAAGLVTLLFLQITSSIVTNNTFPPTIQSIITLAISAFIAGFIPFQILDRATGQLKEQLKIAENIVKGKEDTLKFEKSMRIENKKISDFERERFLLANKVKLLPPDRLVESKNQTIAFSDDDRVRDIFNKMEDLNIDSIDISINGKSKNIKLIDIEYQDLDKRIIDFLFKNET
jgi:hypothetical protein